MARLITTIAIRPELSKMYELICDKTGNFSEWVCNRIERAFDGDESLLLQIDGLQRQLNALKKEIIILCNGHGVIRKEIKDNPNVTRIYDIMLEEFENAKR